MVSLSWAARGSTNVCVARAAAPCWLAAMPDDATSAAAAAATANNEESVFKTLYKEGEGRGRDAAGFSDGNKRLIQSFLINRRVADATWQKTTGPVSNKV